MNATFHGKPGAPSRSAPDPDAPDPTVDWVSKDVAATRAGVTPKRFERLAREHHVRRAAWRDAAGGPVKAWYHPDDVDRLVAERQRGAAVDVLPAGPAFAGARPGPTNGNGHGALVPRPASTAGVVDQLAELVALVREALLSGASGAPPAPDAPDAPDPPALNLGLRQAAKLTGLSTTYLKQQVVEGKLAAKRDRGALKFRRRDLEAL